MSEDLKSLLEFDALAFAEKLTGTSYKEDESTGFLGMALHMENSRLVREELGARDDTHFGTSLADYLRIAESIGFRALLCERFDGGKEGEFGHLYIMWHDEYAILLSFDTYWEWSTTATPSVNGGKFYYNWIPNDRENGARVTSSGGYREHNGVLVWSGDHDCREALRFKIDQLATHGQFLKPIWVDRPFLWLLHWMDDKAVGYDYKAINEQRMSRKPESCPLVLTSFRRCIRDRSRRRSSTRRWRSNISMKRTFEAEDEAWTYKADRPPAPDRAAVEAACAPFWQPMRLEKLLSRDEQLVLLYPSSLLALCSAYIADLEKETEIPEDVAKLVRKNVFKAVKGMMAERGLPA